MPTKTKIRFVVEALTCLSVGCYRENALSKKCFWLNTFNQSDLLLPFGGVNLCKSGWISFQCYKKNLLSVWNLSMYLLYSTYNNFFLEKSPRKFMSQMYKRNLWNSNVWLSHWRFSVIVATLLLPLLNVEE